MAWDAPQFVIQTSSRGPHTRFFFFFFVFFHFFNREMKGWGLIFDWRLKFCCLIFDEGLGLQFDI